MNEQEIRDAKIANGRIEEAIATLSDHVMDLSQSDLLVLYLILQHRGFDPHSSQFPDPEYTPTTSPRM